MRRKDQESIQGVRLTSSTVCLETNLNPLFRMATPKLDDIIARVVEVADPECIILFGSAARGEMGPHSDLDLLVVKKGHFHRGRLTEEIYMNLIGVGQAVDVVIATPDEVERYRDSPALVIAPALQEGRIVYDAARPVTAR